MKKKLTYVDPLKLGITLGIIYAILSLVFMVPIFFLISLAGVANTAGAARPGAALPAIFSGIFLIFLPIIYAVLGFIGGIIMAFVYNLTAKWTGGIEFTVSDATQ